VNIVRQAGIADAEAISALNADVQALHAEAIPWRFKPPGPATFPPAEIESLLATVSKVFFIAEANGVPAGYLYAEIARVPERSQTLAYGILHIHHISVRPQFRRQGLARHSSTPPRRLRETTASTGSSSKSGRSTPRPVRFSSTTASHRSLSGDACG
jgi:GNAT superfamily N-acetyltransferase